MSITPENSSGGWPSFGEHFNKWKIPVQTGLIWRGHVTSLHLPFYLASWGMYRGRSFLLQKDYLIHLEVVKKLRDTKQSLLNNLSFDEYLQNQQAVREQLLNLISCIRSLYGPADVTDTLATKILLGTLGCTPAYDRFFILGLRKTKLPFSNLNGRNFEEMMSWCLVRRKEFERAQREIQAKASAKSRFKFNYPMMKITDMYFWSLGFRSDRADSA